MVKAKPKWGLALLRQSKQQVQLTSAQKKVGHFAGKFWIWGDKKKTHIKYIQMAIRSRKQLPPGFYKACSKDINPSVTHMGRVAKKLSIREMKQNGT